jgi:hypothetical protein
MVPRFLRRGDSTIAAAAVFLLAACTSGDPAPIRLADEPPPREHVVAGPLRGRTGAFLTVRDAASRVRLVLAAMPGQLYRISTPAGSGLAPRVTVRDGRILATLRPTGADGPDEVRIVLNRDVRWDIRLPAGAGEQQLDLRRGRFTRLELGASGLVELRLPAPVGTVPVTLTDDAGRVTLTTPPATPLRVELGGVSRQTSGWARARNRYVLRARESIGALTLRRTGLRP